MNKTIVIPDHASGTFSFIATTTLGGGKDGMINRIPQTGSLSFPFRSAIYVDDHRQGSLACLATPDQAGFADIFIAPAKVTMTLECGVPKRIVLEDTSGEPDEFSSHWLQFCTGDFVAAYGVRKLYRPFARTPILWQYTNTKVMKPYAIYLRKQSVLDWPWLFS